MYSQILTIWVEIKNTIKHKSYLTPPGQYTENSPSRCLYVAAKRWNEKQNHPNHIARKVQRDSHHVFW
jgi:hypothetical protein